MPEEQKVWCSMLLFFCITTCPFATYVVVSIRSQKRDSQSYINCVNGWHDTSDLFFSAPRSHINVGSKFCLFISNTRYSHNTKRNTFPHTFFMMKISTLASTVGSVFVALALAVIRYGDVASCYNWLSSSSVVAASHDDPSSPSLRKFAATAAPRVLNVHVIPHTHDDVGWRKTVEQYYYGLNMTMDARGRVRDIITTTIASLLAEPARTFTWTESKFLHMWWKEQAQLNRTALHDSLRYLIALKQWSFVNGGWCMHDEAAAHYMGMMDQTTTGHLWLQHALGVIPTIGWQLDPFGHSAVQASLFTARTGFDALYFGRIDYQDLALRRNRQACEGLWQPSQRGSLSVSTSDKKNQQDDDPDAVVPPVFWGLTGEYGGNYGPPGGFCFDILCDDESLVDDNQTRLLERMEIFVQHLARQANETVGNHIMVTMGSDFHFQNAAINFANIDLLISSLMNFQDWNMLHAADYMGPRFDRINIFYSTPEYYTAQKNQETIRYNQRTNTTQSLWETKHDDFFPYADCPHCYWTGYFTSRTAFKRLERVASAFLQAVRQIDSLPPPQGGNELCDCAGFEISCCCDPPLFALEDALGVAQHHDAISGTAKQHVADDYSKRVQAGLNQASGYMANALKDVMLNTSHASSLPNLMHCQLLNETKCEVSEKATAIDDMYVIVYNPVAIERSVNVRLPVAIGDRIYHVKALGERSNSVLVVRPTLASMKDTDTKYVLHFSTGKLPPVGAAAFLISVANESLVPALKNPAYIVHKEANSTVSVTTDSFKVYFDVATGAIRKIATSDVELPIEQQWGYYEPFDSRIDMEADPSENSGAYIFRPATPEQALRQVKPTKASFIQTSVGLEVHVAYEEPWVKQITRVTSQPFVEIEYTIGPVPIEIGRGKEIVTRFVAPIENKGIFYTDSNGREFQKRARNFRPSWNLEVNEPIAGNYYPVNAAIFIEDKNVSFSVLTDRTRGGSSIKDGSLEVMVQRRTVADDHRGVDEPMNETVGGMTPYPPYGNAERIGEGVVVSGIHRLVIGKGTSGAEISRGVMDGIFAEPLVFVGSVPSAVPVVFERPTFSVLGRALPLPPNVMLTTLMRLRGRETTSLLLRLGHQYAIGESLILSRPVKVNLSLLLAGHYDVLNVTEKTLSGNQNMKDYLARRYNWTRTEFSTDSHEASTTITLKPMEIRTFEIQVKEKITVTMAQQR